MAIHLIPPPSRPLDRSRLLSIPRVVCRIPPVANRMTVYLPTQPQNWGSASEPTPGEEPDLAFQCGFCRGATGLEPAASDVTGRGTAPTLGQLKQELAW